MSRAFNSRAMAEWLVIPLASMSATIGAMSRAKGYEA
jgi:hypothetical protein